MTTYDSTTTLAEIRAAGPCEDGWAKLLRHTGKTKADNDPLPLLTVLDSNGLDDAAWCLRVPSLERLSRHFGAWCAEQVLHLFEAEVPDDMRPRKAIAVARDDNATPEQRSAAHAAAWDAARSAARSAAWAAARAAARAAAWDAQAARDAAQAAAWDAWAAQAAWDAGAAGAAQAAWDAQERQLRKMLAGEA